MKTLAELGEIQGVSWMKQSESLSAPQALQALMEGKRLRGSNCDPGARFMQVCSGFFIVHPDGTRYPLLAESLRSVAPFTIVEDSPKEPELPEYLDTILRIVCTGRDCDADQLGRAILRAVDERISAAMKLVQANEGFWREISDDLDDIKRRKEAGEVSVSGGRAIKEHESECVAKKLEAMIEKMRAIR